MRLARRLLVIFGMAALGTACESDPVEQAPEGDIKLPMELTTAKKPGVARDDSLEAWLLNNTERFYGARIPDSAFTVIAEGIGTRRIVMLGEHDGAIAQHAALKTSIVRALHERHGFNVLAIEGPMWQCTPTLNPTLTYEWRKLQSHCATGDWNNSEISELFQYVESTQASRNPLVVIGLDASTSDSALTHSSIASLVTRVDPAYAKRLRELDSVFSVLRMQGTDGPIGPRRPMPFSVALGFDTLSQWFTNAAQQAQTSDLLAARYAVAAAAARTSAQLARVLGSFNRKLSESLDGLMAENLAFVADTLYPSQKVIVWSRNERIVRNLPANGKYVAWTSSMAAVYERARPGNTPYSVALFGVSGDELRDKRPRALPPPTDGSIEQLLFDSLGRTVLLAANSGSQPSLAPGSAAARSRRRTSLEAMQKYDAVLVVSNVTAATPIPRR
jgi:erythromycin esterase